MALGITFITSFRPSPLGLNAEGTNKSGMVITCITMSSLAVHPLRVMAVKSYLVFVLMVATGSCINGLLKPIDGLHK